MNLELRINKFPSEEHISYSSSAKIAHAREKDFFLKVA